MKAFRFLDLGGRAGGHGNTQRRWQSGVGGFEPQIFPTGILNLQILDTNIYLVLTHLLCTYNDLIWVGA